MLGDPALTLVGRAVADGLIDLERHQGVLSRLESGETANRKACGSALPGDDRRGAPRRQRLRRRTRSTALPAHHLAPAVFHSTNNWGHTIEAGYQEFADRWNPFWTSSR